jgi:hypothetical protein
MPNNGVGRYGFGVVEDNDRAYMSYSHDAEKMFFGVGGADRMTITAGNVGIGTGSPGTNLHITDASDSNLKFSVEVADEARIISINDADNAYEPLKFYGSRFEFLSGNVGIGTASPAEMLHLYSTADNKPVIKLEGYQAHDTDDAPKLLFYLNDDNQSGISDNTDIGAIDFRADDKDGGSDALYASIRGVAQDPNAHHQGVIDFYTNQSSSSGLVRAMQIYYNGNVGIGTAAPARPLVVKDSSDVVNIRLQGSVGYCDISGNGGAGSDFVVFPEGTEKFRVKESGNITTNTAANDWCMELKGSHSSGQYGLAVNYNGGTINDTGHEALYYRDTGAVRFTVRSNGGIANFQSNDADLSDETVKKNIVDAPNYLEKINQMKVRNFKYKDQTNDRNLIGVIAQEVESVESSLVDSSDELKRVHNKDIMFMMLKSIQELSAKVEALENA